MTYEVGNMADVAARPDDRAIEVRDEIDRAVPIPYYYQLEVLLRDQIARGRWKAAQRVPSEKQLCERYGVSRTTVRQAVGNLVQQGLLYHLKGKGTFVGPRTPT
jgi:GntR family transcriptional regulator